MTEDTYTIGEVLNRLKDEFDDITISKIRYLESEGLISPDRTDSGYRKFTDPDVERLRYVLRAQRDRYLPLKVIKEELDRIDAGLPVEDTATAPSPDEVEAVRGDSPVVPQPADPAGGGILDPLPEGVQLNLRELCEATGLEHRDVAGLRDHGLLGDGDPFDVHDLRTARAAAALMQLGLEPRHLRMYRLAAERESGVYEQLVTPLLRQRNPDSRRSAEQRLEELARYGAQLHHCILARALRGLLGQ